MKNKDYNQGFKEGIERAITIAKSMGISGDFINRLKKEINQDEGILKLNFGESYLILEESKKVGKQIIKQIESNEIGIIILTRDIDFDFQSKYSKFFYITYENMNNSISPTDLSRIDSIIRENLREKEVVYLESIEYLYNQNQDRIQPLMKLISSMRDFIYKNKGILIVSTDPGAFKEQDFIQIKREFKNILDYMGK